MNHVAHPLSSADVSIFHQKSANFAVSKNADIVFWYIISNSCNFLRVFRDYFNKHGYSFDDVSKMASVGFLQLKVFWSKR